MRIRDEGPRLELRDDNAPPEADAENQAAEAERQAELERQRQLEELQRRIEEARQQALIAAQAQAAAEAAAAAAADEAARQAAEAAAAAAEEQARAARLAQAQAEAQLAAAQGIIGTTVGDAVVASSAHDDLHELSHAVARVDGLGTSDGGEITAQGEIYRASVGESLKDVAVAVHKEVRLLSELNPQVRDVSAPLAEGQAVLVPMGSLSRVSAAMTGGENFEANVHSGGGDDTPLWAQAIPVADGVHEGGVAAVVENTVRSVAEARHVSEIAAPEHRGVRANAHAEARLDSAGNVEAFARLRAGADLTSADVERPLFAAVSSALAATELRAAEVAPGLETCVGQVGLAVDGAAGIIGDLGSLAMREDGLWKKAHLEAAAAQFGVVREKLGVVHEGIKERLIERGCWLSQDGGPVRIALNDASAAVVKAQDLVSASWAMNATASVPLAERSAEVGEAIHRATVELDRYQAQREVEGGVLPETTIVQLTEEQFAALPPEIQEQILAEYGATGGGAPGTEGAPTSLPWADVPAGPERPDLWSEYGVNTLEQKWEEQGILDDRALRDNGALASETLGKAAEEGGLSPEAFYAMVQEAGIDPAAVGSTEIERAYQYAASATDAEDLEHKLRKSLGALEVIAKDALPEFSAEELKNLEANTPLRPLSEADLEKLGSAYPPGQKPPQALWHSDSAANLIHQRGLEQGGLSPEDVTRNGNLVGSTLFPDGKADPSKPVVEFDAGAIAALCKKAGIPLEKLDANQLDQAAMYANGAKDAVEQQNFLAKALDNLTILTKIGTPKLSDQEIFDQIHSTGARFDGLHKEKGKGTLSKAWQDTAYALNNAGDHDFKVGKTSVKMTTSETGEILHQESSRPSFWSKLGKIANIALTVCSFIPGPVGLVARGIQAGISLYKAIKNGGSFLSIVGAAASFVGAGASAIGGIVKGASAVANGAAGIFTTVSRVAGAVSGVTRGIQGIQQGGLGGILTGVAGVAGGLAGGLSSVAGQAGSTLNKFADRLSDFSNKLQNIGGAVGAAEGYLKANKAVDEAKTALAAARASGDPAAIRQAEEQLAAAEQGRRSAIFGGVGTLASIGASTFRRDAAGNPEDRAQIPGDGRSPWQVGLEVTSRLANTARAVNERDWASAGTEALGALNTLQQGTRGPEKIQVYNEQTGRMESRDAFDFLGAASGAADGLNAWRKAQEGESAARAGVEQAEAALRQARASGDPAAIREAEAQLEKARHGWVDAQLATSYAQRSASERVANSAQSFLDTRQAQDATRAAEDQAKAARFAAANQAEAALRQMAAEGEGAATALGAQEKLAELEGARREMTEALQSGDPARIDAAQTRIDAAAQDAAQSANLLYNVAHPQIAAPEATTDLADPKKTAPTLDDAVESLQDSSTQARDALLALGGGDGAGETPADVQRAVAEIDQAQRVLDEAQRSGDETAIRAAARELGDAEMRASDLADGLRSRAEESLAATAAVTTPPPPATKEVSVKAGDALEKIARANNVTVAELRAANPQLEGDVIRPGDVLNVPLQTQDQAGVAAVERFARQGSSTSGGTLTVQPGENLTDLAARHGTTVGELLANNPQLRGGDGTVFAGQVLKSPVAESNASLAPVRAEIDAVNNGSRSAAEARANLQALSQSTDPTTRSAAQQILDGMAAREKAAVDQAARMTALDGRNTVGAGNQQEIANLEDDSWYGALANQYGGTSRDRRAAMEQLEAATNRLDQINRNPNASNEQKLAAMQEVNTLRQRASDRLGFEQSPSGTLTPLDLVLNPFADAGAVIQNTTRQVAEQSIQGYQLAAEDLRNFGRGTAFEGLTNNVANVTEFVGVAGSEAFAQVGDFAGRAVALDVMGFADKATQPYQDLGQTLSQSSRAFAESNIAMWESLRQDARDWGNQHGVGGLAEGAINAAIGVNEAFAQTGDTLGAVVGLDGGHLIDRIAGGYSGILTETRALTESHITNLQAMGQSIQVAGRQLGVPGLGDALASSLVGVGTFAAEASQRTLETFGAGVEALTDMGKGLWMLGTHADVVLPALGTALLDAGEVGGRLTPAYMLTRGAEAAARIANGEDPRLVGADLAKEYGDNLGAAVDMLKKGGEMLLEKPLQFASEGRYDKALAYLLVDILNVHEVGVQAMSRLGGKAAAEMGAKAGARALVDEAAELAARGTPLSTLDNVGGAGSRTGLHQGDWHLDLDTPSAPSRPGVSEIGPNGLREVPDEHFARAHRAMNEPDLLDSIAPGAVRGADEVSFGVGGRTRFDADLRDVFDRFENLPADARASFNVYKDFYNKIDNPIPVAGPVRDAWDAGLRDMVRDSLTGNGDVFGMYDGHFMRFLNKSNMDTSAVKYRVYVNMAPEHAGDLARQIVSDIVPGEGVSFAKFAPGKELGQRADNAVIYVNSLEAAQETARKLRDLDPKYFAADTPRFTDDAGRGISIGAEPALGNGRLSFGKARADAIAEALRRSEGQGFDAFQREVDRILRDDFKVDPQNPAHNDGALPNATNVNAPPVTARAAALPPPALLSAADARRALDDLLSPTAARPSAAQLVDASYWHLRHQGVQVEVRPRLSPEGTPLIEKGQPVREVVVLPEGNHPLNRMAGSVDRNFGGTAMVYDPQTLLSHGGDAAYTPGRVNMGHRAVRDVSSTDAALQHELRHMNVDVRGGGAQVHMDEALAYANEQRRFAMHGRESLRQLLDNPSLPAAEAERLARSILDDVDGAAMASHAYGSVAPIARRAQDTLLARLDELGWRLGDEVQLVTKGDAQVLRVTLKNGDAIDQPLARGITVNADNLRHVVTTKLDNEAKRLAALDAASGAAARPLIGLSKPMRGQVDDAAAWVRANADALRTSFEQTRLGSASADLRRPTSAPPAGAVPGSSGMPLIGGGETRFRGVSPSGALPSPVGEEALIPKARFEAIKSKLDAGQALSSAEVTDVLRDAMYLERKWLTEQTGRGLDQFTPEYAAGLCEPSALDLAAMFERDYPGMKVHASTVDDLFQVGTQRIETLGLPPKQSHAFAIGQMPDGRTYLLDPTFVQFMDTSDEAVQLGLGGATGAALLAQPGGRQIANALVRDGFIELTPEVARIYGAAFLRTTEITPEMFVTSMWKDADYSLAHTRGFQSKRPLTSD